MRGGLGMGLAKIITHAPKVAPKHVACCIHTRAFPFGDLGTINIVIPLL